METWLSGRKHHTANVAGSKKPSWVRIPASPLVQNSAYGGYFVSTDEEVESLCLRGGAEYLYNYIRMKLPDNFLATLRSLVFAIIVPLMSYGSFVLWAGLSASNNYSISTISVISSAILCLLWLPSIPVGLYFSLANKKAPRELIVTYLFFTGLFLLLIFMFSRGGPAYKMLHGTEFECSFYSGHRKDQCYSDMAYVKKDVSICYDKIIGSKETQRCVSGFSEVSKAKKETDSILSAYTFVEQNIGAGSTPFYRNNKFGFTVQIPLTWTKYALREDQGENSFDIYFALPIFGNNLKIKGISNLEIVAHVVNVGLLQIMTVSYFDAHKHDCDHSDSQCFFPKEITRDENYVYGLGMPRPNFFSEYCPPEATAQDHYICGRGGNSFPENIEKTFKLTR